MDVESEREINFIEESDILTIEHINTQIEQEKVSAEIALAHQISSDLNIVSVNWTENGPIVITESILYWGDY